MNEVCPVCESSDCHYWALQRSQTWHPAPAEHQPGIPTEYLKPLWRYEPGRKGPFSIGLDPREACFVIANGATLDGVRYRCSFNGWGGTVDLDGRVTVRCDPVELAEIEFVDCSKTTELA